MNEVRMVTNAEAMDISGATFTETEGLRLKITFESRARDDKQLQRLFQRLSCINLSDKKKRSFRRRIPIQKKDKVKKTITFEEREETEQLFSAHLTNFLVSVTKESNGVFINLKNKNNEFELNFPLCRWKKLVDWKDEIKELLQSTEKHEEWRNHLGGGLYAEVNTVLELYFMEKKTSEVIYVECFEPTLLQKTTKGFSLTKDDWIELYDTMNYLNEINHDIRNAELCMFGLDHLNQAGYYECNECNPFTSM